MPRLQEKYPPDHDFTVVGRDGDNNLICRPTGATDSSYDYNCGETAEEFGIENLTVEEKRNIGLMRPLTLNPLGSNSIPASTEGGVDDLDR